MVLPCTLVKYETSIGHKHHDVFFLYFILLVPIKYIINV